MLILLILLFDRLDWLPPTVTRRSADFNDWPEHIILRALTAGPSARHRDALIRSAMLETMRQNYITTAGPGLRQSTVVLRASGPAPTP